MISLHQDSNYPVNSGGMEEIGGPDAQFSNINIPLHPGSGNGAYNYAFDTVVIPALERFKPQFIFVSSGFDASFLDPLGAMMLTSSAYRDITASLVSIAEKYSDGRIIFSHEGGYSKDYVPYCGLAVIEELSGERTDVIDPNLEEAHQWGYQYLLPHQAAVIDAVASLHGLLLRKRKQSCEDNEDSHTNRVADAIISLLKTTDSDRRRSVLRKVISFEESSALPDESTNKS